MWTFNYIHKTNCINSSNLKLISNIYLTMNFVLFCFFKLNFHPGNNDPENFSSCFALDKNENNSLIRWVVVVVEGTGVHSGILRVGCWRAEWSRIIWKIHLLLGRTDLWISCFHISSVIRRLVCAWFGGGWVDGLMVFFHSLIIKEFIMSLHS